MLRYLIIRTLQTIMAVLAVATLIFLGLQMTGDPMESLAPQDMSEAQVEELRKAYGLDKPIHVQYVRFMEKLVKGDLGISFLSGEPALRLVLQRFPTTFNLVLVSMLIAVVFGLPMGVAAAIRADAGLDRFLRFLSVLGISAPTFWIGIMLILIFSVNLGWLPSSGLSSWKHYLMPAFTLSLYRIALFLRMVRSTMLDVLNQDFIRTARAKGLMERVVVYKHALRNALIPFITVAGLQFGALMAGAVVTEKIFAIPGMNRLALDALYSDDRPVIIAFIIVTAVLFAVVNLVVDLLYALIDPRVRYA
jgi:peptide/nickel transport system permease protein